MSVEAQQTKTIIERSNMKSLLFVIALGIVSTANAAVSRNELDSAVAQIQLWSDVSGSPVYYGVMNDHNGSGPLACLEIAFIRNANGVLTYAHKMWQGGRGCDYQDTTSHKVDNFSVCAADSSVLRPDPRNPKSWRATTLMTKQNIDVSRSIFREVDSNKQLAGQIQPCGGKTGMARLEYVGVEVSRRTGQKEFVMRTNVREYRVVIP